MRILIIEDEEPLADQIRDTLIKEKYQAECCYDGETGLEKILVEEYDLIVLDIMLPKIGGFDIIKKIRKEGIITLTLMLTAKTEIDDRVKGLDSGADDYLTKPFAVPELLARIRSLLRRMGQDKSSVLTAGELTLDTVSQEVQINGKKVDITSREYTILQFLMYNKNRAVSRLSLAEHVWGDNLDLFSMTNFIDVHIKNIRKKIGESVIQTIRGTGYMIKSTESK
jgi:DNA-binding response OmpR family regulator